MTPPTPLAAEDMATEDDCTTHENEPALTWTGDDARDLRTALLVFAEAGGRGVDLAERIDALRARRAAALRARRAAARRQAREVAAAFIALQPEALRERCRG